LTRITVNCDHIARFVQITSESACAAFLGDASAVVIVVNYEASLTDAARVAAMFTGVAVDV